MLLSNLIKPAIDLRPVGLHTQKKVGEEDNRLGTR